MQYIATTTPFISPLRARTATACGRRFIFATLATAIGGTPSIPPPLVRGGRGGLRVPRSQGLLVPLALLFGGEYAS